LKLVIETIAGDRRADPVRAPWRPFLGAASALAAGGLLGLAATAFVALRTSAGLRLDETVLDAVSSTALVDDMVHVDLRSLSHWLIALLLLALGLLALLALVRLRFDLVLAAVIVVAGANPTTHFLQHDLFTRPGLSPEVNGLPSQHMTVALSVALAALIVAPRAWRSVVAIGVSAAATLVGVSLVLGRWHRPSDVIAAVFVCVVWAAVGLLVAGLVRRRSPTLNSAHSAVTLVGALIGSWMLSVFLVFWGARPPSGLPDLGTAVISIGSIGLACALSVSAVARVADRHLG
jgi:hypothetical protein